MVGMDNVLWLTQLHFSDMPVTAAALDVELPVVNSDHFQQHVVSIVQTRSCVCVTRPKPNRLVALRPSHVTRRRGQCINWLARLQG